MLLFMIVLGQSLFAKDSFSSFLVPAMSKTQMYEKGNGLDLVGIFLVTFRKYYRGFQLVEAIRTERGRRQRILLNLGKICLYKDKEEKGDTIRGSPGSILREVNTKGAMYSSSSSQTKWMHRLLLGSW